MRRINFHSVICGETGLVDRVLALHAGIWGFDSYRAHMSERFFRSNRPGYPHQVSSELENSGIRAAVGDCSVTERRRWRPPYQTGKTAHTHAKHYKHNKDGRTAPGVCGNGSVPLGHSGNVVTRIGTHTVSFCILITECQHLQSAHKIFSTVNSGPLIGWQNFHFFTCKVTLLVLGNRSPDRAVLSLTTDWN